MARTISRIGRTRRLRKRRWNILRMPMKMQSKVVGKRHSRRFASAAADAACRTTTFFFYFDARRVWSHGCAVVAKNIRSRVALCFLVKVGAHLRGRGRVRGGCRHGRKLEVQPRLKQESSNLIVVAARTRKGGVGLRVGMSPVTPCKRQRAAQMKAKGHKKVLQECK